MARRLFVGSVVCAATDKTLSVSVERRFVHPVYGKTVRLRRKYAVHDPENIYKVGDTVTIRECAPHSKTKSFEVVVKPEAC